jgi:hypothetical protein
MKADTTSFISVYNTISVKVLENSREPISDAEIMVKNGNNTVYSTEYFDGSDPRTDENGTTEPFPVLHGIWNDNDRTITETLATLHLVGSADTWEGNHTINTSLPGIKEIKVPDIDAPMVPKNLTVRPLDLEEKLLVQWDPNTDDTTYYMIYSFLTDVQRWELVEAVAHPQTSWISGDLGQNKTGIYKLKAFDGKYESGFTKPAFNNTKDLTDPSPPTNMEISDRGTDYILISWTPPGDEDLAGYEIEMNESFGQGFLKIGEAGSEMTEFNITGLSWGVEYTFRIRSFDHVPNFSEYSVELSASTRILRFSVVVNVSYGDEGPVPRERTSCSSSSTGSN